MSNNYYQILEVPANADESTIKKSFRKLALLYHPDKNPNNELKLNHYLAIQTAYKTLLDPVKRKEYDTNLWLEQKNSFYFTQAITPHLMIKRLQLLTEKTIIHKQFYVLEDQLSAYLLDAINDTHFVIFQTKASKSELETFTDYIILLSQDLPKPFRDKVFERLSFLVNDKIPDIDSRLLQIQQSKKSNDWFQKNLIWLLSCIGLLLCIIMYWYAKK